MPDELDRKQRLIFTKNNIETSLRPINSGSTVSEVARIYNVFKQSINRQIQRSDEPSIENLTPKNSWTNERWQNKTKCG
ncbi:MAG: hypothetical protein MHMPM18_003923 [Marteilia pararefringens]